MNERTQELYAKACLYARDKHFEDKDVPAFIQCMSEKFAELIVQECASICYNSGFKESDAHAQTLLYEFNIDNCRSDK
jgi:hypothetical protein